MYIHSYIAIYYSVHNDCDTTRKLLCHIRKHQSAEFECSSTKSLTNQFANALQTD